MDIAKIRKKLKQGGGSKTRKLDGGKKKLKPSSSRDVSSDTEETEGLITPSTGVAASKDETLKHETAGSSNNSSGEEEEESVPTVELLSFRVGRQFFAFRVEDVQEIRRRQPITPVPGTAHFLAGITSLRGTIIPVMDFSLRLVSDTGQGKSKWKKILVAYGPKGSIGVLLEEDIRVLTVPVPSLEDVPDGLSEEELRFISGVVRENRHLVFIIDVGKLFNFSAGVEAG